MAGKIGQRISSKADKGWWYRATDAERLAQIDAGIALGMTAKQIAMNCQCEIYAGSEGSRIKAFAYANGRSFNREAATEAVTRKQIAHWAVKKAKSAIQRGVIGDEAFGIFGTAHARQSQDVYDVMNEGRA